MMPLEGDALGLHCGSVKFELKKQYILAAISIYIDLPETFPFFVVKTSGKY